MTIEDTLILFKQRISGYYENKIHEKYPASAFFYVLLGVEDGKNELLELVKSYYQDELDLSAQIDTVDMASCIEGYAKTYTDDESRAYLSTFFKFISEDQQNALMAAIRII